MIIQKLQQFGKKLVHTETSLKKLTDSTCLGIFIAFSPFVGFHTILAVVLSWLLSFNIAVTLMVACLINNPWTMLPVYSCDYFFGRWICSLSHIDLVAYVPNFLFLFYGGLGAYVGLSPQAVLPFLVGGTILSISLSIAMYSPTRWLFQKFIHIHK